MKMQLNRHSIQGFSLLELCTVLAIIAMLSIVAIPAFQDWNAKRSFDKAMNEFYSEISDARLQAMTRNAAVRFTTSRSGDNYAISMASNSSPTTTCTTAVGWTSIKTTSIRLNTNFEVTGSGIGNVCFFKDGTSSGGIYNIVQKNGQTNLGNGNINIFLATGFVDVTKN